MEASCSSSRCDDKSTEDFYIEVPIINLGIKEPEVEVLLVNNAGRSKNVTNSEPIVIEETEHAAVRSQKELNREEDNSIVIDDEEKVNNNIDLEITALNIIHDETINKTDKNLKESDTSIDLDQETDNVTTLNGNRKDSDVIILDGNKTNSDNTIILNDDEINEFTQNKFQHTDVIDVEKDTDCSIVNVTLNIYDKTEKEFRDLIQKCLSMKNSAGMTRVINRTLLVIYKDVDESCKKSDEFKDIIAKTSTQLDAEPERKFSHIKNLCDWLKQHKIKKKVPFITLDKRKNGESTAIPNKRFKVDIIDLVDDSTTTQCSGTACKQPKKNYTIGKVYPSIDLDSSDGDVMENDDVILLNKENTETVQNRNKKKSYTVKKKNYNKRKVGRPRKYLCEKPNATKPISNISDPAMLLEPRMSVRVKTAEETQAKINAIETRIAHLKSELEEKEEAEVLMDDYSSPYLACEQIKARIVKLYKQLCKLAGTETTKRHEVRLQVVAGHAEGPVRCLEEFLNENIDEDGNPPFPDMSDVTQCVCDANCKYNLGWTTGQILTEAQALFTQFGQTMQKRRQKREWKDMMSLVKREVIDPADEDPALQARLEENKRIAKRKESDLLDRFAKIEFGIRPASEKDRQICSSSNRGLLRVDQSEESDEDSDQYPDDNSYGDLFNSRTDTEKVPNETVNGVGFGASIKNTEHPLNKATPTMIHVRNFETAIKNCEHLSFKVTPTMVQVRSFETATKNTEDSLNKATPNMIQVRNFETAIKNSEHPSFKATPTMVQVRCFETVTKNNELSLNKATPTMIQVRNFETAIKNSEHPSFKVTPTMIQVRSFETATKNTEDSLNNVKPSVVKVQGAVCASGNGIVCNTNKIVDNVKYGTTLNALDTGKIAIQPAIQYLPDKNTNLTPSTNFSSEYCRFINTYDVKESSLKISYGKRNTPKIDNANYRMKCNETDIEKAAKFARDIISLVQSGLNKNCLANNNSDLSNSPCNPTVRLTQLDMNDLPGNINLNTNPALMFDNVNSLGENSRTADLKRCNNVNTNEITQSIEQDNNETTDNITSNVENEMEVKIEEEAIKLEPLDIPSMLNDLPSNNSFNTNHSALMSDNDGILASTTDQVPTYTNVLENEMEEVEAKDEEQDIKPEPLDIPRMLEELGEGFTATIFDIEDPFLVIEISDSSESEEDFEDV